MKILKLLFELSKVSITFAVSLTTIAGYLLASGRFDSTLWWTVLGLFILACGSAVLNQYQEYEKDAMMERTAKRPIPSGRISPQNALLIAVLFIAIGTGILWNYSGMMAMSLGLITLLWYNGIYTWLKKKTALAVIPGSVIGSLPPLIGWVAAGGELFDTRALFIAFFFFIWQVPHFWLLLLKYGKQYEEAGFPSLTANYSDRIIRSITFLWVVATAITAIMLAAFGIVDSKITAIGILIASLWVVVAFVGSITNFSIEYRPMRYFMKINIYVLCMIILLSVDSFI